MDFWLATTTIATILVCYILLLFKLKPADEPSDFSDLFGSLQDGGQTLSMAQRRELLEKHEEERIKESVETKVENVTLEILKEIESLSDTKGRHILHLARMYVPSVLARPRAFEVYWTDNHPMIGSSYVNIYGRIFNSGSTTAYNVVYTVRIYDAHDTLLKTEEIRVGNIAGKSYETFDIDIEYSGDADRVTSTLRCDVIDILI